MMHVLIFILGALAASVTGYAFFYVPMDKELIDLKTVMRTLTFKISSVSGELHAERKRKKTR